MIRPRPVRGCRQARHLRASSCGKRPGEPPRDRRRARDRGVASERQARIVGAPIRRDGLELDLDTQVLLKLAERHPPLPASAAAAAAREEIRRSARAVAGAPIPIASVHETTIAGAEGPLRARLYVPLQAQQQTAAPLIVYYHGGGWVVGGSTPTTSPAVCSRTPPARACSASSTGSRPTPLPRARRGRARCLPRRRRERRATGRRSRADRRRWGQRRGAPRRRHRAAGGGRQRPRSGVSAADLPRHRPRRGGPVAHHVRRGASPGPAPPWWAGVHLSGGSAKVTTARVPRGPEFRSR